MKVSDYIVAYLIEKEITDVFGYPGGMVTHLMESFRKYRDKINAHVTYHEQGAAFAACGYAQTSGKTGVAYATSGPGATNLITGICDAYFDSIPCLFLTGQVNISEAKGNLGVRQRGFQETDIVSMVKGITKYAAYVASEQKIKYYLDRAFYEAESGRPGPVLLDIPMNIFRAEVDVDRLDGFKKPEKEKHSDIMKAILEKSLQKSERPLFLFGNGVKNRFLNSEAGAVVKRMALPFATSMTAFDLFPGCEENLGFIGAYGDRAANFAVAKSDLIIAAGTRMDVRQVGAKRENFAPDAKIIRIDIDAGELEYKVHPDEIQIQCTIEEFFAALRQINFEKNYAGWKKVCQMLKKELDGEDESLPNDIVKQVSRKVPDHAVITADVGQNQVWLAQSFEVKKNQRVLFSGGHGAMGYSLPAAIGAYFGSGRKPVMSFSGDGGFQMNIQELQFIAREQIPVKMVVLNNDALGMIRHFQEMYFEGEYFQTKPEGGYTAPDFAAIAKAYGIRSMRVEYPDEIDREVLEDDVPILIEVMIKENTYVFPKLEFGKPNQDQEPLLERDRYEYLMKL